MSRLYEEIVSQRGSFERLVARIPGFRGYQDKQARRQADTLLRDYVAFEVKQRIDDMVRIEKIILNNAGMSYMTRTRNVKGKIQRLHDELKATMPGYSGMWAQLKIGPDELERIYSFDEAMLNYVDRIDKAVARLKDAASSEDGLEESIIQLDDVVTEALEAYSLRDHLLTNLDLES